MRFEEALEAMRKGKRAKRARWSNSSIMWIDQESGEMYPGDKPRNRSLSFEEITADDWVVISEIPLFSEKMQSALENMDDTLYKKILNTVPMNSTDIPETEGETMYKNLEITFKSGETITYKPGEWDDYAYDGGAVIVKRDGAWVGIYNFADVFCVELKK